MPEVADALDLLLEPDALRDDGVQAWFLDLRSAPPRFATPERSVISRVADRFAARVAAGHDALLGIASGLLSPARAAGLAATAFADVGQGQTPLAVIRGEDVAGELEAWHALGEPLTHANTGRPLFGSTAPLIAAAAPPDAGPLRAAWNDGARLIVSSHGSCGSFADAIAANEPVLPTAERRPIVVWQESGWCVDCGFRFGSQADRAAAAARLARLADTLALDAEFETSAGRIGLGLAVAATGGGPGPLADFVDLATALGGRSDGVVVDGRPAEPSRQLVRWPTDVAADRVRYAADVRPASEWLDDYPNERPA